MTRENILCDSSEQSRMRTGEGSADRLLIEKKLKTHIKKNNF